MSILRDRVEAMRDNAIDFLTECIESLPLSGLHDVSKYIVEQHMLRELRDLALAEGSRRGIPLLDSEERREELHAILEEAKKENANHSRSKTQTANKAAKAAKQDKAAAERDAAAAAVPPENSPLPPVESFIAGGDGINPESSPVPSPPASNRPGESTMSAPRAPSRLLPPVHPRPRPGLIEHIPVSQEIPEDGHYE